MRKLRLSVVIPTLNCGSKLEDCLSSIRWADEIIVVDMGSTDNTIRIAKKFHAIVYERVPRDGNFDKNRKFGMQKASGDWILKLDSDEVLSRRLQSEIKKLLFADTSNYAGFNLKNKIFMFGHQISHGFVKADSHELRLVRAGKWHYDPFKYHQQIFVRGEVGFLSSAYNHYNYTSIGEFIEKTNKYTDLDAKFYPYKVSITDVLLSPLKTFFKLFFLQEGFLDGYFGIIVCFLFAIYNLVEKIKVWELQNL
ncbi:glycosyltransferase family 2 protein [Patescibacteria group bacterium]|nr:glycosyltransferase family 2 protein [Patescibacteria group bacterium]